MNEYLVMLWGLLQGKLLVLSLLTALDFVVGVIISLVKKDFKWEYLMHYLNTDVLPIFGWVVVVLLTTIPAGLIPPSGVLPIASDTVYATVFLSIIASILKNLAEVGILKDQLGKIGIK